MPNFIDLLNSAKPCHSGKDQIKRFYSPPNSGRTFPRVET